MWTFNYCNHLYVVCQQIRVDECTVPIKSIELQLVRVETCGCAEGYSRDGIDPLHWVLSPVNGLVCTVGVMRVAATEIQNIQVGEGDVRRARDVPLYMVLPRLFTCPTTTTHNFKIGDVSHTHSTQLYTQIPDHWKPQFYETQLNCLGSVQRKYSCMTIIINH